MWDVLLGISLLSSVGLIVLEGMVLAELDALGRDALNAIDCARALSSTLPLARAVGLPSVLVLGWLGPWYLGILAAATAVVFLAHAAELAGEGPDAEAAHSSAASLLRALASGVRKQRWWALLGGDISASALLRPAVIQRESARSILRISLLSVLSFTFTMWALFVHVRERGGTVRDLIHFLFALSPPALRMGLGRVFADAVGATFNHTSSLSFQLGL
jgi:hypothetical protein